MNMNLHFSELSKWEYHWENIHQWNQVAIELWVSWKINYKNQVLFRRKLLEWRMLMLSMVYNSDWSKFMTNEIAEQWIQLRHEIENSTDNWNGNDLRSSGFWRLCPAIFHLVPLRLIYSTPFLWVHLLCSPPFWIFFQNSEYK